VLRGLSIRARLTLVSTLIVAVGMAVGGVLLVLALQGWTLRSLDDSARHDGQDIANLIDSGQAPDPLPTYGSAVAQVVDSSGGVVLATPGGDRLVPLLSTDQIARVRRGGAVDLSGSRLGDSRPYRVVGVPAGTSVAPTTVLVAVSLADQERTSVALRWAVAAGGLALTLALALASWLLIGSSLRPVEALRRGAADITGAGASRRLPVPDAQDEVRRLAETLNDMLGRLDVAAARQRAFIADAAHELRSPIASLRTQLEVALMHPGDVDLDTTAREALLDVDRMARLVADLMVLARLDEADRRVVVREPVDLGLLVREVVGRRPPGRVPVVVADVPLVVQGDRAALSRVVDNLVDNAERHAASSVHVVVAEVGGLATVTVSDDGPGVPAADRERIFERFTRLDHGRDRDQGGAGLGLAIVAELVQAHGGTISVEDAAPGARFVVALPNA
jgi:signal transduction histidine kinase